MWDWEGRTKVARSLNADVSTLAATGDGPDDPCGSLPAQDILCSVICHSFNTSSVKIHCVFSGFSLRKVLKAIVKEISNPNLPHTAISIT